LHKESGTKLTLNRTQSQYALTASKTPNEYQQTSKLHDNVPFGMIINTTTRGQHNVIYNIHGKESVGTFTLQKN